MLVLLTPNVWSFCSVCTIFNKNCLLFFIIWILLDSEMIVHIVVRLLFVKKKNLNYKSSFLQKPLSLISWKGFPFQWERCNQSVPVSILGCVWVLHLYQICCFIPLAELLGLWSACNVQLVFQFVCLSVRSSLLAVQEWILWHTSAR